MKFIDIAAKFNLALNPKSGREDVLLEMANGKRPFDAAIVRDYVKKGFHSGYRSNEHVLVMVIKHHLNDVADLLLQQHKVNLHNTPTLFTGIVFSRPVTDGDLLLKAAVDSNNEYMMRKIHSLGVPADLETARQGVSGSEKLYMFQDLWKSGHHLETVLPVLKELYPADAARHQAIEQGEITMHPDTVKATLMTSRQSMKVPGLT